VIRDSRFHLWSNTRGLMEFGKAESVAALPGKTWSEYDKARLLKGDSTVITETKLANDRWAEEQLQAMMRQFQWTREEAVAVIKEKAPTWAEMLM
jgi:hypothetical protein